MLIREYTDSDKDQVVQLLEIFWDHLVSIDPQKIFQPVAKFGPITLDATLKETKENGFLFVGFKENKVIGIISGVVIKPEELDDSVKKEKAGRISQIIVHPEHREKGYGQQLIEKAEEYFRSNNCYYVEMEVFVPNENAHALYKN